MCRQEHPRRRLWCRSRLLIQRARVAVELHVAGPSIGAAEVAAERVPEPPDIPADGGGPITLGPSDVPIPLRFPRGLPPAAPAPTAGGGGTTLVGERRSTAVRAARIHGRRRRHYFGWAKNFSDQAAHERSAARLRRRRRNHCSRLDRERCRWRGGADLVKCRLKAAARSPRAPAWSVSECARVSRSGAETGGGTTATFAICTGEDWIFRGSRRPEPEE